MAMESNPQANNVSAQPAIIYDQVAFAVNRRALLRAAGIRPGILFSKRSKSRRQRLREKRVAMRNFFGRW